MNDGDCWYVEAGIKGEGRCVAVYLIDREVLVGKLGVLPNRSWAAGVLIEVFSYEYHITSCRTPIATCQVVDCHGPSVIPDEFLAKALHPAFRHFEALRVVSCEEFSTRQIVQESRVFLPLDIFMGTLKAIS